MANTLSSPALPRALSRVAGVAGAQVRDRRGEVLGSPERENEAHLQGAVEGHRLGVACRAIENELERK